MLKLMRRWWKYLTAKLTGSFEDMADPKVQLEQAVAEARERHRRLREQAANVIANQKKTELQLDRKLEELEKVNANVQQALVMADEATDPAKATEYTQAAETLATKLIAIEAEVEALKDHHFDATEAAEQAKEAVKQNRLALEQRLAEQSKLLGQLDQAKMQEEMNEAMAQMSEEVGEDVPTLEEVKGKIEARYAKAKGMAELTEGSVDSRMREIEQATSDTAATARLAQMREQLGLGEGSGEGAGS